METEGKLPSYRDFDGQQASWVVLGHGDFCIGRFQHYADEKKYRGLSLILNSEPQPIGHIEPVYDPPRTIKDKAGDVFIMCSCIEDVRAIIRQCEKLIAEMENEDGSRA